MTILDTLTLAERARQLRDPEGEIGLAIARWTGEHNLEGNRKLLASLSIEAGNRVLEIGFGDGRMASEVVTSAQNVHYSGIDSSSTMVEEAERLNTSLVAEGRADFTLGSAEKMPFRDGAFDRVFSVGVVHFWAEPETALAETRRVLRPGGLMLMGCLAPTGAPPFARSEYGFHLRDAPAWNSLCRAAGLPDGTAEELVFERPKPGGGSARLHTILLTARA